MSSADKKEFVIKQVFTDIPTLKEMKYYHGKKESHFNIPWKTGITRYADGSALIYLSCPNVLGSDLWSVETKAETALISATGEKLCKTHKHRHRNSSTEYPSWFHFGAKEMEEYIVDGILTVEMKVKITKMRGFKEKLRNFDESAKEFSDMVLSVNDEKFYVLKTYLAAHSTYFKSLFAENFEELGKQEIEHNAASGTPKGTSVWYRPFKFLGAQSTYFKSLLFGTFCKSNKSEIELKDIKAHDFQNFLEVIYGEPAIDDGTVDRILRLADMFDSKTAIRRCEEFLLKNSQQTLKKKFEAAVQYKMDKLMEKCLAEIKTKDDAISLTPKNADQMEPAAWAELFNKLASFQ